MEFVNIKEKKHRIKQLNACISVMLIIILGFVAYANSLSGKFVLDDNALIKNNAYIRSWGNLAKRISLYLGESQRMQFRPLIQCAFTLDYSLWRLDTKGYHLTNIILHILVAISIYWLIRLLFQDNLLSLLTSLLFVVHPIHTEAVSYISGRADSLVSLFMLLCIIFYIKQLKSGKAPFYILMLITCILATFSKENSLILSGLLLLYHYAFRQRLKLTSFIPILAIAFTYVAFRVFSIKTTPIDVSTATTVLERIPGFFVAVTNYIRLLFLPLDLHLDYGQRLFSFTHPQVILGMIITLGLLLYAIKIRKSNKLTSLAIGWFFITLLPVSNLYPVFSYMAEHFLYLPSIGFFLVLASGLSHTYKIKKLKIPAIAISIILLCFYSYLTIRQNEYWRNPIAFYKRSIKYSPDSALMYTSLGWEYKALKRYQEAIEALKKAIKINPEYEEAHYNLGLTYAMLKRYDEAIIAYKKAIKINPDYEEVYISLGTAYKSINRIKEAQDLFEETIKLNPYFAQAHNNLGVIYYDFKQYDQAASAYKKAIELHPDYAEAYNNLGLLYSALNQSQQAVTAYQKAIESDPGFAEVYNNLGREYEKLDRINDAISSYKEAVKLDPDFPGSYNNLGVVYYTLKQYNQAVASYQKAIQLNPQYAEAYNNLGLAFEALGKSQEAISSYKRAIEIDPSDPNAYNNLSIIYLYQQQYQLAVEYSDRAQQLGFDNPALREALEVYRKREVLIK